MKKSLKTKKLKSKLNIGCGIHLVKGFLNLDAFLEEKDIRSAKGAYANALIEKDADFIRADMRALPFKDNTFKYIESVDAIEHIPQSHVPLALYEMRRVLKKGGKLVVITTDFTDICKQWMRDIAGKKLDKDRFGDLAEIIYGNQIHGGEFHQSAFTKEYMEFLLKIVGFTKFTVTREEAGTHPKDTQTAKYKPEGKLRSAQLTVTAIK